MSIFGDLDPRDVTIKLIRYQREGFPHQLLEYLEVYAQRFAFTQRKGQALFNALSIAEPELAEMISGSSVDPFYLNSRIPEFLAMVHEYIY